MLSPCQAAQARVYLYRQIVRMKTWRYVEARKRPPSVAGDKEIGWRADRSAETVCRYLEVGIDLFCDACCFDDGCRDPQLGKDGEQL